MAEFPDHHRYTAIHLYRETLDFFIAALRFYEGILAADLKEIEADPDLRLILGDREVGSLGADDERMTVEDLRAALEDHIASRSQRSHSYDLPLTHGDVRLLKAVSELYVAHLKSRRDAIARRPALSRHVLGRVDEKLASLGEKTTIGVFSNATALPLLAAKAAAVAVSPPQAVPQPPATGSDAPPVLLESIQILDPELRSRCMDLFHRFRQEGATERLDTVVTEATRILENRLRSACSAPATVTGTDLATHAFAGSQPRLRVSSVSAEQEAAHLLVRGVFGFVRNPVHHHLVEDLRAERVLQIVGMIDYLLSLFEASRGA